MLKFNLDIKSRIKKSKVRNYEIARALGKQPSNFCTLLNFAELNSSEKQKILKIIETLEKEKEQEE